MKKFIVHLLAAFIPISKYRKKFRNWCLKDNVFKQELITENKKLKIYNDEVDKKNNCLETENQNLKIKCKDLQLSIIRLKQENKIQQLKSKVKNKNKIKVCFSVIYDSVFPASNLYEQMLDDDIFDPFILVIPDTLRGEENMFYQMDKTYKTLSYKYKNVFNSYDYENQTFIDWSDKTDILCPANPYDVMTHKDYRIEELAEKGILPIYFNYGYPAVTWAKKVASLDSLSKMWKLFSESDYTAKFYSEEMKSKGKNIVISGYIKMDKLARQKILPRQRKTIIIAPHHTIESSCDESIGLSNFLIYSDLFKELPKMYPQIDFIFRPHPWLKSTLEKEGIWGKDKTKIYFEEIEQNSNMIFQNGGDYFETFVNSDGIIHDCSSFLAEYMFTGKPVCYMLRNSESIDKYFMDNGKEIISHCYKAYNKENIINFIDNVILKDNDTMRNERLKFVENKLKVNYPNVTDFVLDYLKNELIK